VGFVVNAIQRRIWHPTGAEDDHEAIFTEYAASEAWVATHFAEFVLVLVALAGLLVLCGAARREIPWLALLAAGAVIATGAIWAVSPRGGWRHAEADSGRHYIFLRPSGRARYFIHGYGEPSQARHWVDHAATRRHKHRAMAGPIA
jgi:hypothetical protein